MAVILERIDGLRSDVAELKCTIQAIDARERDFERMYVVEHSKLSQTADAAHRRLDGQEKLIGELRSIVQQIEKQVSPLVISNKIAIWIASGLGLSIIGLIWALITGRADVIFR